MEERRFSVLPGEGEKGRTSIEQANARVLLDAAEKAEEDMNKFIEALPQAEKDALKRAFDRLEERERGE